MNNTKTIFKSLLIMIVAISLFTVSCSKDESGTKPPTTPTIQKVSAQSITDILKARGDLNDSSSALILTLKNIDPKDGSVNITAEKNSYAEVVKALKGVFTTANFNDEKIVLTKDIANTDSKPSTLTTATLDVDLIFKANSGFEFDATITSPEVNAKKYIYDNADSTAKLTLKIAAKGGTWQN